MNIFILDIEPMVAAKYHSDIHLRAMIKESAQMMSTAHRVLDDRTDVYKTTHINNRCMRWVRQSMTNYDWLYDLFCYMHEEYVSRFNKPHLSYSLLADKLREPPEYIDDIGLTPFAQAMPVEYQQPDVVQAYRNYYCTKLHFCHWSPPAYKPWWVSEFLLNQAKLL